MLRRVRKILTFLLVLPAREKLLVLELAWEMARARWELRRVPFRDLASTLGRVGAESPLEELPGRLPGRLAGHVASLAEVLPWECLCLVQAVAARRVLDRRRQPTTLYLGVRIVEGRLEAHAWLRWGTRVVTGARGREGYRVVVTFH